MAAGSLAKASVHEPVGTGPLWKHKGWQLPAYIQHIANDLREKRGMSESRAIATAVAAVKRWAAGGGNVSAETRAAAAKAVAEWEKLKAKAHAMSAAKAALSEDDNGAGPLAVYLSQIDAGEVDEDEELDEIALAQVNVASLRRLDAVEQGLLEYIKVETDPDDLLEAKSLLTRVAALQAKDKAEQANGGSLLTRLSDDDLILCELFLGDESVEFAADEDGNLWKTIMREGQWKLSPGPGQRPVKKPITVVAEGASDPAKLIISMSELVENFKDGAVEHVSIPTSHENKVTQNTGFVRGLRMRKDDAGRWTLQAKHDFTEPEVKGMALRGTIANTSAGVLFDYLRKEDGKKYGAVLEHVALTNKPWLSGMTPFGMADEGQEVTVMTFSEEDIDALELSNEADDKDPLSNEVLEALMSDGIEDDDAAAEGEADVALADSAKKPYGNVTYADPGYQSDGKARYPIDSEEHCRAAWSYINKASNAAKYSSGQLSKIKARIRAALKRYGVAVEMSDDQLTAENEFALVAFLAEADANTSEGGASTVEKETETPQEKTADEIVAESLGLSIEEAKAVIAENAAHKATAAEAEITAKVEGWTEDKKSPALLSVAESILRGEIVDNGVNLSEDGKTVTLSVAEVVGRLVAASPAVNLDEEQVTEEESTKGTAPEKEGEEVELSDEVKSEARRLFLYEGKSEDEAIELAKAALDNDEQ